MLNSIQRTSNYQNSRPNFGMALTPQMGAELIRASGDDIKLLERAVDLTARAAKNLHTDIGFSQGDDWVAVFVGFGNKILKKCPDYVAKLFDTVEKGILGAENYRNSFRFPEDKITEDLQTVISKLSTGRQ